MDPKALLNAPYQKTHKFYTVPKFFNSTTTEASNMCVYNR